MNKRILDFINFNLFNLKSIHGSRDIYYSVKYNEIDEEKDLFYDIENITGKTLYIVTTGRYSLINYITSLDIRNFSLIGNNLYHLNFKSFSIYFFKYDSKETEINIRDFGASDIFIDAKKIILPRKTSIKNNTWPRIYIFIGQDGNIYKAPSLIYPKNINSFLRWEKRVKNKVPSLPYYSLDCYDNIETWSDYELNNRIPRWDITSDEMIEEYLYYINNIFFPKNNRLEIYSLSGLVELSSITQDDVYEFEYKMNNEFKIYR